jgi:ribonuclease HI
MRGLGPARDVVVPAQVQLSSVPITVATDGSAHRGRIGWGWLASNGQHDLGEKKPPHEECSRRGHVGLAELRAISEAIEAFPGRPLTIRSDSKVAIALVREWMRGSDRMPHWYAATHYTAARKGGLIWMREQVRREAHRIDITWVQAHAGDALNEGADSLAKLARRAAEGTWGFTTDDVPGRAKAVAEAFATEQRQVATAA